MAQPSVEAPIKQPNAAVQLPRRCEYHHLQRVPFWDVFRGDLRFEKIVVSLAPQESAVAAK